ncbi:hypothetical protein ACE193_04810 [Bernardetia sp. OM2101]|uniref:hypothetical protein n=1 Tax=Bernardetia sp. OM2101 TaxID=3344876 RepID=UPI0035CF85B0
MTKYKFQEKSNSIISKNRNSISSIRIYEIEIPLKREDMRKNLVAHYEAKVNTYSKKFSLKDFSSHYFRCKEGCSFFMEKGKAYMIRVFPKFDGSTAPIFIKVEKDGQLKSIKIEDIFQI